MYELIGMFFSLLAIDGLFAFVGYLFALVAWGLIATWSKRILPPSWRSMGWALVFTAVLLVAISAAGSLLVYCALLQHVDGDPTLGWFIVCGGLLVGLFGTIGGANLYRHMG